MSRLDGRNTSAQSLRELLLGQPLMPNVRGVRQTQAKVAIGIAIGLVAGLSLVAVAQTPSQEYTGCLTRNGSIVNVAIGSAPAQPCKSSDTPITWNSTGPAGEPGPSGQPGPEGPAGRGPTTAVLRLGLQPAEADPTACNGERLWAWVAPAEDDLMVEPCAGSDSIGLAEVGSSEINDFDYPPGTTFVHRVTFQVPYPQLDPDAELCFRVIDVVAGDPEGEVAGSTHCRTGLQESLFFVSKSAPFSLEDTRFNMYTYQYRWTSRDPFSGFPRGIFPMVFSSELIASWPENAPDVPMP